MSGFEGVGDFNGDPFERHAAHQAAKGRSIHSGIATLAPPVEQLGPCVICGEAVTTAGTDDPAEMHSPEILEYDYPEEIQATLRGTVHAQCGLDRGWVIS